MDKLFLLDAYALIYRAYYAFIKNPRINSKGENTSAILGFVNTLEEVLQKEQPTHIGVAFDPHGGTFRHEEYPPYKAQREETPEAIRFAVPKIKELLAAYKIPVLEVAGFEADDVIGTLAHQADQQGITTFMMTPDKDYGQLVTEHVSMYRPAHGSGDAEVLGPKEVCEKWGIQQPVQVIDLLGLMGDSSDNFPGCPGVGEKTAAKLINEFGSIEELLARSGELKGAIKTKIESNVDDIKISKWLATIRLDVPITLDMESLKREEPNSEAIQQMFTDLEFRHLLKKKSPTTASTKGEELKAAKKTSKKNQVPEGQMDLFSMFDAAEECNTAYAQQPNSSQFDIQIQEHSTTIENYSCLKTYMDFDIDYVLVDTPEKRRNLLATLTSAKIISWDTETSSLNTLEATLVGMSFCIMPHQAYYVPIYNEKTVEEFRPIFEDSTIKKVGQNMKFDLKMLANYGIRLKGEMCDTMIAHYLLHPEMRHSMDYLAEAYLKYKTIHIDELIGKKERGKKQKSMDELKPKEICTYACEDADITLQLWQLFEPQLKEGGVDTFFRNVEMPLMTVLAKIELNGVKIDTRSLTETSALFTNELYKLEEEIIDLSLQQLLLQDKEQYEANIENEVVVELKNGTTLTGKLKAVFDDSFDIKLESNIKTSTKAKKEERRINYNDVESARSALNISSPKQIGELLFEKLKLDSKAKKTKSGQYTTSEEVLESIKSKHPVVGKILEYRGLKKLLGTYIDALPLLIQEKTGHVHTSFNQTVTTTGRLSSSDPNLQNIPVRDASGKEVRKAFIPDEGEEFFSADYSQIELRIMAHLSQDKNLIDAFQSGYDIHAATAAKIFHKDIKDVTSDERRKAKTANFGIIYGISAFGLADRIGCSRSEAKSLIDGYFETYPGVKEYIDKSIERTRQLGYTETLFGRRCYIPTINENNSIVRGHAERNAINSPIQGTAADIIKIAMVRVAHRMEEEGLRSKMILQVHDELNFSVIPEEKTTLQQIVVEEMEHAAQLSVPLKADFGWGTNWLEAH